ncbi:MAG TPA: Mut7-C RNAse domain-containing protein [Roseiflexaceae bacterium]|nr:Mut7-C RNAse domain-containing protein [Roseiflexaceae bacterium]
MRAGAATVTVRCHGDLNDFLPPEWRGTAIAAPLAGHETVKHILESLGVPHPEIGGLLVNGAGVGFGQIAAPGDQLDAYPAALAPSHALPLRPPLPAPRFVADAHLGRLAAYLRMLGLDTLYRNDYHDAELARLAHDELRVLLTRDVGLLKRGIVTYGAFVRATLPQEQLREVVRRFALYDASASFQRCISCNGPTAPVEKAAVLHRLEPKTRRYYDTFRQCLACGKIYWPGSHYARMRAVVQQAVSRS